MNALSTRTCDAIVMFASLTDALSQKFLDFTLARSGAQRATPFQIEVVASFALVGVLLPR